MRGGMELERRGRKRLSLEGKKELEDMSKDESTDRESSRRLRILTVFGTRENALSSQIFKRHESLSVGSRVY